MNETIYISGKIGPDGVTDEIRLKFAKVEDHLRSLGFDPMNPAEKILNDHIIQESKKSLKEMRKQMAIAGFDPKIPTLYGHILVTDMELIMMCDSVYFLSDWKDSPGAAAELSFAIATRKKVYFQTHPGGNLGKFCENIIIK